MPKVKLIIIFYLSLVLFLNLGCKTFEKNEWTIEPYYSKKGNPSFENNLINYCGNIFGKKYDYQWEGTPIEESCQIGNSNEFKSGDDGVKWPEDNFYGFQKTKCASILHEPPKTIWVPNDTLGWCPYRNPEVKKYPLKIENGFIKLLKNHVNKSYDGPWTNLNIDTIWRKGFSAMGPSCDCYDYFEKEWNTKFDGIIKNQAILIYNYLRDPERSPVIGKILETLLTYKRNNAFEYLYFHPFSIHTIGDDYSAPDFYNATLNDGLVIVLPGIILMYGILKEEIPENPQLSVIKNYISKLVWLTEQGIETGKITPISGILPDPADHHTVIFGYIHLLWGITSGNNDYYEAGLNHFFSNLQNTRSDGSIKSEIKKSPKGFGTHGGWGSLSRMNANMKFHAMSAVLLKSQGHPVEKINFEGVTIIDNIKYIEKSIFNESIASQNTGVSNHDKRFYYKPSAMSNLSWYLFANKFIDYEPNIEINKFLKKNYTHYKSGLFIYGFMNSDMFSE